MTCEKSSMWHDVILEYIMEPMCANNEVMTDPDELASLPALPEAPSTMTEALNPEPRDDVIARYKSRFGVM